MGTNFLTPNMNLLVPVVGQEPGPDWASDINNSLSTIDAHNHAAGSGVAVTPSGLNINADLPIGKNNLTLIRSARFFPQSAALSLATDLACLYVSGSDLYYNDASGNQVRITSGGAVNATSSGISSGTASASFVSSVLVVNQAANTPANIQAGSVLFGNNTAGSNFITVAPPNALASNYQITLPGIPASQSFLTLDNSGNMSASWSVDNSTLAISANQVIVKNQGITQGKLALRATGTTVVAGGVAVSASSGAYANSGTVPGTVVTCTITTTGRPVFIGLMDDGTASDSYLQQNSSGGTAGLISILRGATPISESQIGVANQNMFVPPGAVFAIDFPTAGTYTYNLTAVLNSPGGTVHVNNCSLVVYEL